MFGLTIVIAGDDSSTDIRAGSNLGVTDISEVAHTDTRCNPAIFDLAEIPDMDVGADSAAAPNVTKRSDVGPVSNRRVLDPGGPDYTFVAHGRLIQDCVRPNCAIRAN